ncbi:GntR family transcriptional regulator [Paenibacillus cellulositrophicus]|uniref:GntR family transcriptional regulator n=2 Tax=Paenibacillus TaxID=44249 RepID=A0A1R1F3N2_9BACL|nr:MULTISPECIES: GntR family transcriptional regulator [Paenibacillus]MBJ9991068.1 GntR family transcriptional regulator [Paenibacillus sp. S28]OMF58645.1 GntR family transcriptional regulator [Paenibacillus rhizosphaerae]OXL82644.1 GntR family transcriptional regulator [Paenibacillus sp. SSG-1]PQP89777.1 GntR family transcriptional regulator [Paenibacillus sp. AR247]UYO03770.1 GntR family transcriptional regulator [Paenibacillus sp. PSB04]
MSLSRKDRPLYIQIKHILKERILHGVYPKGENIPSEPQLEKEFAVSKITIRAAVSELVSEGFLEKGSGRGTKVIRNTSVSKLAKWKHFTEVLVEEGHQIRKLWLQVKRVTNDESSEAWRLLGETSLLLERVYFLDDRPYIYYTHYVTPDAGEVDMDDLNAMSLYEWLEGRDIPLGNLRDEFTVAVPPEHVQKTLGLDGGTPVLKRLRYSYDELGQVIEYSIGYYHTGLQNYVVTYDR